MQGQEFTAVATLKNPLPVPLKKGEFLIEGPGVSKQMKIKLSKYVLFDLGFNQATLLLNCNPIVYYCIFYEIILLFHHMSFLFYI